MKPNLWMMGGAISVRQLYLPWKVRVRQWGALPPDRGPTVLITNHQYINEGEIVISRIFLRDPRKALVMVNSRRTFETGFFASRLPWTAPFLRRYNASDLWARFSILPVENHLFSRTLLSLAEEIRAAHGDLALEDVVPADRVANLDLAGKRLGDLWELPSFFKAQATVKLSHLRDPYRREAIERGRATTAADVARIVDVVRAGATFYVTPEGDFSNDGRMHRMRGGITDAVLPHADPWLCAIAYDPFRGKRLGMLYRIVQPADVTDLGASLAAARPVTMSALLATVLLERGESLAPAATAAAVAKLVRDLPPGVFVDPEVRRNLPATVAEARAGLRRSDPRFPHVADMIAYQKMMLDETISSARALARRADSSG